MTAASAWPRAAARAVVVALLVAGVLLAGWLALPNLARVELNKAYLGRVAVDGEQLARAAALAAQAPGGPDRIALGRARLLACRLDQAEAEWRQAAPFSREQAYFLHRWVSEQGPHRCDPEQSLLLAERLWPAFPHAALARGLLHSEAGEYEPAVAAFEQALAAAEIAAFPHERLRATFMLARAHQHLGRLAEAQAGYRATVALDPANQALWFTYEAHVRLGDLLAAQGDYAAAAQAYVDAHRVARGDGQRATARARVTQLLAAAPDPAQLAPIVAEVLP
jgi:tetratricopeptide (TPR) repeat protein